MADRDLTGCMLGDYLVVEPIGEGGYATVYRCIESQLKRTAVVKVLHERHQSDEATERFTREAQLASRLDHQYAAHVYAFGVRDEDGSPWIAMEMVRGITLRDWLKKHGRMPLDLFVPFYECVAEVVEAAHALGIVHRDLTPSNIMVIERGQRLVPKVLDWGIAKVNHEVTFAEDHEHDDADGVATAPIRATPRRVQRTPRDPDVICSPENGHELTSSGAVFGSAPYMSPEQTRNTAAVGPKTDIYSLGVVGYEALTGRQLFTAENITEYYERHRNAEVPPLGGDFSSDLDRVFRRALAKTPEARHGTARELASELRAALRASVPELLRSSAQQWEDQARAPALLLRGDVLAGVERWTRSVPSGVLSKLECSYLVASQRRARRFRWVRRSLVALAATSALGGFLHCAAMQARQATLQIQLAQEQTRLAQEVAEATFRQSELEQGRSALLHDEPDAQLHLSRAYQRGDRSPSTTFMLDRALQPRLAEQARFASTFGRMWSAAFSPDGRQIVMTDDRAAQVWDAQTYRRMFTLFHGDTVYQALYSADGARLVTAGGDGTIKIWDAASGALVRELRRDGSKLRYYIAALSPDAKLVAAIDAKGAIAHVWDAGTGAPVAEIHNDGLESSSLAFSPDGRWLATTGGSDVHVLDTRTWRPAPTIRGPRIHRLAFDPTGSRLLTGATTGDAAIWSVPSGARIRHLRNAGESIDAVAFSPDGQLVALGSRDGVLQVWRAGSGELQSQLNPRHSKILAVEFDRASKLVLAVGADGTVVVADAALGMPVAVLEGPQNVLVAHFDPSSRRVVGASLDGTAWVWDATSPYHRWSSPPVSDSCGIVTTPEPDRRFIAAGCRDRATRVWDTACDQLVAELPSVSHVEGDFTSAFPTVSGTGDRAAIARVNTVEVYELPGRRLLRTIAHGAAVNAVAFGGTRREIVSGAIDGSLLVTRDDGAQLALPSSPGGIDAVEFLPDGRLVASDAKHRLRVYDPSGAVLADIEIPMRVMSLRVDGTRLVTVPIVPIYASDAASPVLVDLERYRVIAQLEGHVGRVFSARWVAGDQILTAGADGTVRLWDGATGQLRQTYRGGSRSLYDATLLSDGVVIAGGADGLLRFWDRASGRQLWALHAHASRIIGIHVEGGDIVTRGIAGDFSRWRLPSPGQVIGACGDHERCATLLR